MGCMCISSAGGFLRSRTGWPTWCCPCSTWGPQWPGSVPTWWVFSPISCSRPGRHPPSPRPSPNWAWIWVLTRACFTIPSSTAWTICSSLRVRPVFISSAAATSTSNAAGHGHPHRAGRRVLWPFGRAILAPGSLGPIAERHGFFQRRAALMDAAFGTVEIFPEEKAMRKWGIVFLATRCCSGTQPRGGPWISKSKEAGSSPLTISATEISWAKTARAVIKSASGRRPYTKRDEFEAIQRLHLQLQAVASESLAGVVLKSASSAGAWPPGGRAGR